MDARQIADRERKAGARPEEGGARRDGACDGIIPVMAAALLFALAFWIAAASPQALEIAANAANGPATLFAGPEQADDHPHPRDIGEDQPEPPIAGASTGHRTQRLASLASLSDQS